MITVNAGGNITGDPVIKRINDHELITFVIANNERYVTKQGELKERTTFVRCNIWNKPDLIKVLFKGRAINVTGLLKVDYWETAEGKERVSITVRVSFLQVFGKGQHVEDVADTHTVDNPAITAEEEEQVSDLPF